MKNQPHHNCVRDQVLTSELLILPDGSILVHNLTQPMADLLRELNPREDAIRSRARKRLSRSCRPAPHSV